MDLVVMIYIIHIKTYVVGVMIKNHYITESVELNVSGNHLMIFIGICMNDIRNDYR